MIPPTLIALGVAVLVAGAATGYATLEHSWRQNAELVAAQEKEANVKNQETILLLKESVATANKFATELLEQNTEILKQKEAEDAAVTELSNSDEDVRKFLALPVPDKLRCLWEHKKCADGTTSTHPK